MATTVKTRAPWIDDARRIVREWQARSVKTGLDKPKTVKLDATTASMLVQIHDALSPENRAKFARMPLLSAVNLGWKLVSR